MNIVEELKERGVKPYVLTDELWEKVYSRVYNVVALDGRVDRLSVRWAISSAILAFQLEEAKKKEVEV